MWSQFQSYQSGQDGEDQRWSNGNLFSVELWRVSASLWEPLSSLPSLSPSIHPSLSISLSHCSQTGAVVLSPRTFLSAGTSRSPQTQSWLNWRRAARDLLGLLWIVTGTRRKGEAVEPAPLRFSHWIVVQKGGHQGVEISLKYTYWVFMKAVLFFIFEDSMESSRFFVLKIKV